MRVEDLPVKKFLVADNRNNEQIANMLRSVAYLVEEGNQLDGISSSDYVWVARLTMTEESDNGV
jgi:hypothetical protein